MKKYIYLTILLILATFSAVAQLKFIIEDFEGMRENQNKFEKEGIFTFGSVEGTAKEKECISSGYSGDRAIEIVWNGKEKFGGWGKGIGLFVQLNSKTDYLNFYVYSSPGNNKNDSLQVILQEDDDASNKFEEENDDAWVSDILLHSQEKWQLISLPLNKFKDKNKGGDGIFNASYDQGKTFAFIIDFPEKEKLQKGQSWLFDFICFSKGKLPIGKRLFDPPQAKKDAFCLLGAWSEEGISGDLIKIPEHFEKQFGKSSKDLGVVHFFQPFSVNPEKKGNLYPSPKYINEVIKKGYIPMITVENHYIAQNLKKTEQPNLYSIVEGHYDYFFREWAKRIKKVQGTILVRILHEFNGDWYSWCTVNNDKDPQLYIRAYRHICDIIRSEGVNNVKFIWCPNSMSVPQESWNYIMKAYPGDDYVDFVGLDVYNGAGNEKNPVWRSFRKEAIENYFIMTQELPEKPLLICETASRERKHSERGKMQDKAEWIMQMSEALQTDLANIHLLTWFNETSLFRINSSEESRRAFYKYIWKDAYFTEEYEKLMNLLSETSVMLKN